MIRAAAMTKAEPACVRYARAIASRIDAVRQEMRAVDAKRTAAYELADALTDDLDELDEVCRLLELALWRIQRGGE